jgi:hypothetical protein
MANSMKTLGSDDGIPEVVEHGRAAYVRVAVDGTKAQKDPAQVSKVIFVRLTAKPTRVVSRYYFCTTVLTYVVNNRAQRSISKRN